MPPTESPSPQRRPAAGQLPAPAAGGGAQQQFLPGGLRLWESPPRALAEVCFGGMHNLPPERIL